MSAGSCTCHKVAGGILAFNTKAKFFIESFCSVIDFENFQFNAPGLRIARRDNRFQQGSPDTSPPVKRVDNDHPHEYLAASILDVRIANQPFSLMDQGDASRIEMSRKIMLLPRFVPPPDF